MSWIAVGVAAGSAILGAYTNKVNADQQRSQKSNEMLANAAQIQYSPWTGAKSQVMGMGGLPNSTTAAINGGLQGGLMGGLMGSQFKKMGASSTPAPGANPNDQTSMMAPPASPGVPQSGFANGVYYDENGNPISTAANFR